MRLPSSLVAACLAVCATTGIAGGGVASAAEAAEAAALKPDQRRALDKHLAALRESRDPLLMLTPLQRIVDLGPAAVEAALADIVPLLDSASPAVRHDALNALRPPVRVDKAHVQRIERLAVDTDPKVRGLCAQVLAEIRSSRDRSSTEQGVSVAEKLPTRQLIAELGSDDLKRRESAVAVTRKRLDTDLAFRKEVASVPASLAKLVGSPDARVREVALLLLARCFDPLPAEAAGPAAETTVEDDVGVASAALEALAHAAPAARDQALAAARTCAETRDGMVRGQALAALAALGAWDDQAGAWALAALADRDGLRPTCTAIAAARLRQPTLVAKLTAVVRDDGIGGDVRGEAMKALGVAAEPKESVPVLERIVSAKGDDKRARVGACTALMLMASDATLALTTLQGVAADPKDELEVKRAAKAASEVIGRH